MHKKKVHIKRKGRIYEFSGGNEKLMLWISGNKTISFSTQEIGIRRLHDAIRNEKDDLSVLKKTIR